MASTKVSTRPKQQPQRTDAGSVCVQPENSPIFVGSNVLETCSPRPWPAVGAVAPSTEVRLLTRSYALSSLSFSAGFTPSKTIVPLRSADPKHPRSSELPTLMINGAFDPRVPKSAVYSRLQVWATAHTLSRTVNLFTPAAHASLHHGSYTA
jgi:hypothetical protein